MPEVVADIVDIYVVRRLNARVQFLLLQRRRDVALGNTWQSFHTQVSSGETAVDAARRVVKELAGLSITALYSADYINQFYDDQRDVVVLAPVLAVKVDSQDRIQLGEDYRDSAWFDRDEATLRLPFTGQRWAVRHIDEIMSIGEAETDLYRLTLPEPKPSTSPISTTDASDEEAVEEESPFFDDYLRAEDLGIDEVSTDVPIPEQEKL
jgi:dihydroneopterin triphosphate diphosphatase